MATAFNARRIHSAELSQGASKPLPFAIQRRRFPTPCFSVESSGNLTPIAHFGFWTFLLKAIFSHSHSGGARQWTKMNRQRT